MQHLKLLHNVPRIGKTSFGIGQISVSLAKAQILLGHNVKIWCLDNDENIAWAVEKHGYTREDIASFKLFGPQNLWFSPELISHALKTDGLFDIVHQHGIWTGNSIATYLIRKNNRAQTIIAPHGSLNSWALNLSHWKKKIALTLYEQNNLKLASCLHATSESEISDFRDFGLKNPIAYIENGIRDDCTSSYGNAKRFKMQYGIPDQKRILLFLSRISPKKGLMMAVDAIASIKEHFHSWVFIIAGVDEFNHQNDIELRIKQMNLESFVKIIGPLFNESKEDAFEAAELFILPSFSEGSPMVVLDSLAAGVPVVTTKASSWSDLNDFKCGWWTDINPGAINDALLEAVSMSIDDLYLMGERGKRLIASKYTWSILSQKTILLYYWLLGLGDKPDFVLID